MDTRAPKQKAPPLSVDCHFHIFGPSGAFPMSAGRSYATPVAPEDTGGQSCAALRVPN
jgi:hypothetical protein